MRPEVDGVGSRRQLDIATNMTRSVVYSAALAALVAGESEHSYPSVIRIVVGFLHVSRWDEWCLGVLQAFRVKSGLSPSLHRGCRAPSSHAYLLLPYPCYPTKHTCDANPPTATAMTLTSIFTPNWVSYTVSSPSGGTVTDTVGLHRRCTSSTGKCSPFPDEARCEGDSRSFCSMWRTAGFLMSFAALAELAALVGFVIIMAGGKVKRQGGWKVLGGLLGLVAAAQFAGMAVVVSVRSCSLTSYLVHGGG